MIIVEQFDVKGNGFDTQNSAIFSVRDIFCDLYSAGHDPLHRFCFNLPLEHEEPEVQEIARLDGVIKVFSFKSDCLYDLHVKKGSAFSWEELLPSIRTLLQQRAERLAAEKEADNG